VRPLLLTLLLGLCCCASPSAGAGSDRPNVVFILLDNVGQEWFGCYGSEEGATPNIDALARGGARVEHCYSHPVCGPSRALLLSGRYPFRTGWTVHHDAALYGGGGFDPARETTIARVLRDAGYATAIAGKWQINNLYEEPGILARHGFGEQLVWPGSIDRDQLQGEAYEAFLDHVRHGRADELAKVNRYIESRYWDPVLMREGRRERHPGRFGPDLLQEFALDFIRRHRDRPFFLYYPMFLTHGQSFLQHAVPTPLNRGRTLGEHEQFADMVRYADGLVGEVIRHLQSLGLRERTIVFVATDNGTEKAIEAKRRGRTVHGGLYELNEAGQVVLIANGPGRVAAGRTCTLADFSDVFPTICDLAGAAPPAGVTLDGRSLAPFLRGEAADGPREWIFNQHNTRRVVRDRRHKLYSTGELFDAERDPDETRNLAAELPEVRARLAAVLDSLPPDARLPFPFRSISAFKFRAAGQLK
jgi:arylsulfatase A-like enzyme